MFWGDREQCPTADSNTAKKVGAVELNEAPAALSLVCVTAWRIDPGIINQRGGAILTGHPLGASGTRLLGTLARSLQASGQRWRVAAIGNGVGQGQAVVVGNVSSAQRKQKGNRGDHANDRTLWAEAVAGTRGDSGRRC